MQNKEQKCRYLGGRCCGCGRTIEDDFARYSTLSIYEFHHIDRSTKHDDYDNVIRRKLSRELIEELDKCALLCNFCHRLVETQRIDATVRIQVTVDGQTGEQAFRGQMIWDKVEKRLTFVTNDRYRLNPYLVTVGKSTPRLEFENELVDSTLAEYLRSVPVQRTLQLRSWSDGTTILSARLLDSGEVELEYDTRHSLLSFDLGNDDSLWVRNGCVLTRDGLCDYDAHTVTATLDFSTPATPAP